MPAYNCQQTVKLAMTSALRALSKFDELLIVDDGSTDNTADVIRSHDDPRITLLVNRTNVGISESLNRGIASAKFNTIGRADADDVTPFWRFTIQKRLFDDSKDDFLFGTQLVLYKGLPILPIHTFTSRNNQAKLSQAMGLACILAHPTLMARRDAITALGGYRDCVAEDYDLWLRGLLAGFRFRKHWFPQNIYRISAGSISRKDARQPNHLRHLKKLRMLVFSSSVEYGEADVKRSMIKFRRELALRDPFLFFETGIFTNPLDTLGFSET